eukprot:1137720-Pelagomonas_calceolata.AAC.13
MQQPTYSALDKKPNPAPLSRGIPKCHEIPHKLSRLRPNTPAPPPVEGHTGHALTLFESTKALLTAHAKAARMSLSLITMYESSPSCACVRVCVCARVRAYGLKGQGRPMGFSRVLMFSMVNCKADCISFYKCIPHLLRSASNLQEETMDDKETIRALTLSRIISK